MKLEVHDGSVFGHDLTAAATAGEGYVFGEMFGVCVETGAIGDRRAFLRRGQCTLAKKSADNMTFGARVYWDDTNKELTLTASGNLDVGHVMVAAGASTTTVEVYLHGASVSVA